MNNQISSSIILSAKLPRWNSIRVLQCSFSILSQFSEFERFPSIQILSIVKQLQSKTNITATKAHINLDSQARLLFVVAAREF